MPSMPLTALMQRRKANSSLAESLVNWLQTDAGIAWRKSRQQIFQDPDAT